MDPLWTCPKCGRGFANRNQFHIDAISPRNQVHVFRLHAPSEVDDEVERLLAEAYSVGQQRHLQKRVQASGSVN